MSRNPQSSSLLTWQRVLPALMVSLFALIAQFGYGQGAALAAPALHASHPAAPSLSATDPTQAWIQAHSAPVKAATLAWAREQAFQPQAPALSVRPSSLTCQVNENCSCPNSFSSSQFYECQWYDGFWPYSGLTPYSLFLHYWINTNLPSSMRTWATDGANNWSNSAANVYFSAVSSQSSADVEIDAWHPGYQCGGFWGRTIPNGGSGVGPIHHVQILLNVDNLLPPAPGNGNPPPPPCASNNGGDWISTAAHELGHALGLEHNDWCPGGGTKGPGCELMNGCSACSGPQTPQGMDIKIVNTMYPWNFVSPSLNHSCGSNWSKFVDPAGYSQSGTSTIPASMADQNTWHVPAVSGASCNSALWSVSFLSGECGDLRLWIPSNYAIVTSMQVTINQYDPSSDRRFTSYAYIAEAPYTGFYDLGKWPLAVNVIVYDSQSSPAGDQVGIGTLELTYC